MKKKKKIVFIFQFGEMWTVFVANLYIIFCFCGRAYPFLCVLHTIINV